MYENAQLIAKLLEAAGYGCDIQDLPDGFLIGVRDNSGAQGWLTMRPAVRYHPQHPGGVEVRYSTEELRNALHSGQRCPDPIS